MAEILSGQQEYLQCDTSVGTHDEGYTQGAATCETKPPVVEANWLDSEPNDTPPLQAETLLVDVDDESTNIVETEVKRDEILQKLQAQNNPLLLSHLTVASGEGKAGVENEAILDGLTNSELVLVDDTLDAIDSIQQRGIFIDVASNTLPLEDSDLSFGERLVRRRDQMQGYMSVWDGLQSKYGRDTSDTTTYVPLPGSNGIEYKAINMMVNGGLQSEVFVKDTERNLRVGHIRVSSNPDARQMEVIEVQKETNIVPVTQMDTDSQRVRIMAFLEQLPQESQNKLLSMNFNNSEQDRELQALCQARGIDYHSVAQLIHLSAFNKNCNRANKLVGRVQSAIGAQIEHIAVNDMAQVLNTDTVTIINPTQSKWFAPDKVLGDYGVGGIIDTEIGTSILSLSPKERDRYLTLVNTLYKTDERNARRADYTRLRGIFPDDINSVVERQIAAQTYSTDSSPRAIGRAVKGLMNGYLHNSRDRAMILNHVLQNNLFKKQSYDMYSGVAHLLGMDVSPFDPRAAQGIEIAVRDFTEQGVDIAEKSKSYTQMFGVYDLPVDIATPTETSRRGKTYRTEDIKAGIDQLKRK